MASRPLLYSMDISHYCIAADRMLAFKGVAFDTRPVPYHDKQELIKATGQDYVPTLVWDGKIVAWQDIPDILEAAQPKPTLYPWGQKGLAILLEHWGHQVLEERVWRYVVTKVPPVLHDDRERWVFEEIREGDLRLRAGLHVADRGLARLQLAFAQEDCGAGSNRVRVVEVLRGTATDEVDVRAEARRPQRREDLDRPRLCGVSDRHDVCVEGSRRLDRLLRFRRHREPIEAERKPGLGDGVSPEDLGQVVGTSAADLLLRAEIRRVDLEDHAGVVVEPADDAHVELVVLPRDAVGIEEIGDFPEILASRVPRRPEDFRGFVEDGGITGQPDELPQRRRQIRPTQPRELRVQHREVPLVEGM